MKDNIILLHGAIGSASQLKPLAEILSREYNVHLLDFSGHGGSPLPLEAFSIQRFANDVLHFIEAKGLARVSILGYSMGGYVAMYLARNHPGKIDKIITLATKYQWDETIAGQEVRMLDPEKILVKLPAFAATLAARHSPVNWKDVLRKTAEMMVAMGRQNPLTLEDMKLIDEKVLLMLGDRDKMVGFDETLTVFKTLPNAELCVLPACQHSIEQVDLDLLNYHIVSFLTK